MSRFTDALDAWHGSHADFDEFRDDKINTGEGAQIYGHGHYVGEARGTGESYRDAVARKRLGGRGYYFDREDDYGPISVGQLLNHHSLGDTRRAERILHQVADHHKLPYLNGSEYDHLVRILEQAHDQYNDQGPTPRMVLDHSKDMHEDVLSDGEFDPSDEEHVESKDFLDSYPVLDKWINAIKEAVGGRLYELKLNLSEPHILDWERPLAQHHPEALEKLKPHLGQVLSGTDASGYNAYAGGYVNNGQQLGVKLDDSITGDKLYGLLKSMHGDAPAASKALLDSGIHAIRFTDQFSRGRIKPDIYLDDKKVFEGGPGAHYALRDDEATHLNPEDREAVKDFISRGQFGANTIPSLRRHYEDVIDDHNNVWIDDDDHSLGKLPLADDSHYAVRSLKWLDKNEHRLRIEPRKPTYNYVVFDPKLIQMVRKYDDRDNVVHDYTQASGTELRSVDHDPFAKEQK